MHKALVWDLDIHKVATQSWLGWLRRHTYPQAPLSPSPWSLILALPHPTPGRLRVSVTGVPGFHLSEQRPLSFPTDTGRAVHMGGSWRLEHFRFKMSLPLKSECSVLVCLFVFLFGFFLPLAILEMEKVNLG